MALVKSETRRDPPLEVMDPQVDVVTLGFFNVHDQPLPVR